MGETVRLIIAAVLMLFGVISVFLGILGVFRFRFVMNRMHCAAIIDSVGLACILLGLILLTWSLAYIPKLLAILALYWVGSPIAAHLVSRMEISTDETAPEHMGHEERSAEDEPDGSV